MFRESVNFSEISIDRTKKSRNHMRPVRENFTSLRISPNSLVLNRKHF
jgi:hypothetical protein